ncbi:MAG: SDR family NAD(P)-dependent oxidoreductase [Gammaproteobacteria bacterium]
MSVDLSERVIVITGAAGGIGSAVVRALLSKGASVVAADVNEAKLSVLVQDLERDGNGKRLLIVETDVSDSGACAGLVEETIARFDRIDGLINNAALGMGLVRADHMSNLVGIEELEPHIWDRVVRVNLSGAWYMTRYAIPHMKARGFGRIINVSTSFFTMLRAGFHPYGPAKAGMEAMAAAHAAEFAGTGITVNVVVPGGPTDTPMVPDQAPYKREDLIPPAKMAQPIAWICGEAGDEITGQRFVAANWDESLPSAEAALNCGAPAAWPELANNPVWPGGKPDR